MDDDPAAERLRFEAELEFVQSLANPEYLHFLAQNRYFDDPQFVDYLEYLQYWRAPPYCLYIAFPQCLRMLELLQTEKFVEGLKRDDVKDYLRAQQHWHWRHRAMVARDEADGSHADGGQQQLHVAVAAPGTAAAGQR